MAWRQKLDWLRIHDYVACCVPFGLFLGRLANFVNGELWGAPTEPAWGVVFPMRRRRSRAIRASSTKRRSRASSCSSILWFMFWKTRARYQPGKLVGTFILVYGLCRFAVEYVREPDEHLVHFAAGDPSPHGPVAVAADDRPWPLSRPHREASAPNAVRPVPADEPARRLRRG